MSMMKVSTPSLASSFSRSQSFSAPNPPFLSTPCAVSAMATPSIFCRRSYRVQAVNAVTALPLMTMSPIANQNDKKMRRNTEFMASILLYGSRRLITGELRRRRLFGRGIGMCRQNVTGSPNAANLRQSGLAQPKLAAQIADVRIDAAIVWRQFAAQHAFGQAFARL